MGYKCFMLHQVKHVYMPLVLSMLSLPLLYVRVYQLIKKEVNKLLALFSNLVTKDLKMLNMSLTKQDLPILSDYLPF